MNEEVYKKIVLNGFKADKNNKYVIYGTGTIADIYVESIQGSTGDENILCFIDEKMEAKEYKTKNVYKCKEVPEKYVNDESVKFIMATVSKIPLFTSKLKGIGINSERIISSTKVFSTDCFEEDNENVERIIIYPAIEDEEKLNQKIEEFQSTTFTDGNLEIVYLTDIDYDASKLPVGYVICSDIDKLEMKDDDLIWVWKADSILDNFLMSKRRIVCCDDDFLYHSIERMHVVLNNKLNTDTYEELYQKNYDALLNKVKGLEYAVVCGMGPSLLHMDDTQEKVVKNGCIIVCNNYCYVDSNIIPHIYVLQDNDYIYKDKEMLENIVEYVIKNQIYLFVDKRWVSILLSKYPGLSPNVIGIEISNDMCFPQKGSLKYFPVNNVVPAMSIPVASGIKDNIYIIGCDGGNNTGAWEHADNTVVENDAFNGKRFLMVNSINTNREYERYVDQLLEKVISYGESVGKRYLAMVKGGYKALNNRLMNKD